MIRRSLRRKSSGRTTLGRSASFNRGRRYANGRSLFYSSKGGATARAGTAIRPRSWIYHALRHVLIERKRLEDARRLVEGK